MIVKLFRAERPLAFFSVGTVLCGLASIVLAVPLFETYFETGLVPRFPTAVLCAALMIFATLFLVCDVILDTVTHGRAEVKRLAYLTFPAPGAQHEATAATTLAGRAVK